MAAAVVKHLRDLADGQLTITHEDVEREPDPDQASILRALVSLSEHLSAQQDERLRSEDELRGAIERLGERNGDLERRQGEIAALVAELSTPIIKVWEGVLMVPLIGSVDSERAADMMHRLLSAVVRERADDVILDFTGIGSVDTSTADHFLRLIASVKLLGARGIVAGVPPSVSLAMVRLGVDLSDIATARNVREALVLCMTR
jgi:rsbT co-antagonist protein RsbR